MIMNYGDVIRVRREELGISLRELAPRVYLCYQQLSKIERGESDPGVDRFNMILNELGLKMDIVEVSK